MCNKVDIVKCRETTRVDGCNRSRRCIVPSLFSGIQYMNNPQQKQNQKKRGKKAKKPVVQRPPPSKPVIKKAMKALVNSAAAAYATGQSSTAPDIRATRDSCRVVHRELIGSVSGGASTAFSVNSTFALNPGLSSTFPWLSIIAEAWEQYRFNSLKVCYYTRCSTQTAGSVLLVTDYDAADPAPATEFIASSYEDTAEDAPWKDICSDLRPSAMFPMGPKKFLRTSALAANEDIKTYDAGNLFVCTVDSAAAAGWGKIWLEYDVSFFVPQQASSGAAQLFLHISGVTPTTGSMMGTQTVVSSSSPVPATVTGDIITFSAPGTFFVSYDVLDGTSDTAGGNPAVANGATLITTYGYNTNGTVTSGNATTNFAQTILLSTIAGGTLVFNNTVVGGTKADLVIVQAPSALT